MMRSAVRGAAGGKEAVSAKTSAGLGKLMSALHQNAASLVNTKAEHNGPDQVLAATEYSSSLRGGAVLLRREEVRLSTAILSHVVMILCRPGWARRSRSLFRPCFNRYVNLFSSAS